MYVVYKLFFETSDKVYIGKTNNISKRISDHMYTVFKSGEDTHKANWIRKHSKLCKLQFEILYSTDDEEECYAKELDLIKEYLNRGIEITNSVRIVEAGGKSGRKVLTKEGKLSMTRRFGIPHILIDKSGKVYDVKCLKNGAEERGLSYRNLHSCVKGKSKSSQGFRVFYKQDWESKTKDERNKIIEDFIKYDKRLTPENINRINALKKEFWILNKDGSIEHGFGITQYCKEKGYNGGNIINSQRYRRPQYGKVLFYSLEDLELFKKNEYYKFFTVLSKEEIERIVKAVSETKKYSRDRGKVIKQLAKEYYCSTRRISDIFNKYN